MRLISSLYTLILMAAIIATMIIVVFGNRLLEFFSKHFPSITSIFAAILTNRMLFTTCIMLLLILTMYKFIPNRKTSFAKELPGAVISSLGWYGFSVLFSVYVDHSANFSYMYGSLATFVIGLIWMYSCMIIVFCGAELNSFLNDRYAKSTDTD
ncbi:MAG: YihY/virulence factor BrkB family protein, partial [Eubacteriales bacterium]|nr:YihY/virulence factor BrkB family protein [Eubacteriales bacterium]